LISTSNIFASTSENQGIIVKHEEWHDVPLPDNLKHGNGNIQNLQTATLDQTANGLMDTSSNQ
jgi:hypothetical protein